MSNADRFQFFVMIGGPFWVTLLLCSFGDWIYRAFTRWRWRTWIFEDNRIVVSSSAEDDGEDHEKEIEEDAEGKQLF